MFTGKEEHSITLEEARTLVGRWRAANTALPDDPACEFFGRDILVKILAQEGCVGLRIYHGRNVRGRHALVLVGATAEGKDLLQGTIAEVGLPCPTWCDDTGLLAR